MFFSPVLFVLCPVEGVSVGGVHGQAKTLEGVIKTADTMKQGILCIIIIDV